MARRIVCIDDSEFVINQLSRFFKETMGYDVVATGEDGCGAVELYREHQPDLITLDLTMPKKDGKEAIKEIIAEFPDAAILVVSAKRGTPLMECLQLGARSYIEKPLRLRDREFVKDLKQTVADVLVNPANQSKQQ
ncbi:MAG: response regulator [Chitinivibrionales bacterium]|nr:response regulator [Chitinivibrionales bacterium]MBD3358176.1 response regulator [Chitinivibrionales bacterium]